MWEAGRFAVIAVHGVFAFAVAALVLVAVLQPTAGAHPSHSRVAVISGESQAGNLFLVEPDGSAAVQLTPQHVLGDVSWSPDAKRIGFTGSNDEFRDAYVMSADGTDLTRVTDSGSDGFRQWSPDGSEMLLWWLSVADADGSNLRSLGDGSSREWSPDGQSVLFTSRLTSGLPADIWIVNRDGTGTRRLTSDPAPEYVSGFSPDGSKILFTVVGDSDSDIWTMNPDGSDKHNLTQSPSLREQAVAWSPDGRRILFRTEPSDPASEILSSMSADGSDKRQLTRARYGGWSPDGSKIVFVVPEQGSDFDGTIGTVKADGSDVRHFTSGIRPAWSPDGTKIAFMRWTPPLIADDAGVYVMNADGTGITVLRDTASYDILEGWEPVVNQPPDCTRAAAQTTLTGHKSRFIKAQLVGVTDSDGDSTTIAITGVTQDEPLAGWRDHTAPDALRGSSSEDVLLRAENSNKGDGRVYRIAFDATDQHGDVCSGVVTVGVPRKGKAIDSDPPSFDSFGG